jgi:tRNA1(Val) A37 N6-methylase TrmN6
MIVKNNLLNFKDAYIYQDTDYFKFSLDSLLLANFVTINLRDKNILDIATGNAPIPMLLSYRTKANIYGVEIQKSVFDLGVKSIIENKMDKQITIINDDAKNVINLFGDDYFDVITCNPPIFELIFQSYEPLLTYH